jgi:hypothetical protein
MLQIVLISHGMKLMNTPSPSNLLLLVLCWDGKPKGRHFSPKSSLKQILPENIVPTFLHATCMQIKVHYFIIN